MQSDRSPHMNIRKWRKRSTISSHMNAQCLLKIASTRRNYDINKNSSINHSDLLFETELFCKVSFVRILNSQSTYVLFDET